MLCLVAFACAPNLDVETSTLRSCDEATIEGIEVARAVVKKKVERVEKIFVRALRVCVVSTR